MTSTFNSRVVAINGESFEQIWNFTGPEKNYELEITPCPGYFNSDNYTDFLIIYHQPNNGSDNSSTKVCPNHILPFHFVSYFYIIDALKIPKFLYICDDYNNFCFYLVTYGILSHYTVIRVCQSFIKVFI